MSGADHVIVVDDEEHIRRAAEQTLKLAGFEVRAFGDPDEAAAALSVGFPGVLVSDIKMPGKDGVALMKEVLAIDPDLPVILITGHGDIAMAVHAMRDGAYDFIEKPFASELLVDAVARAAEKRDLTLEVRRLQQSLDHESGLEQVLIGRSPAMARLRDSLLTIAATDADVLISGETGTGKELASRAIHDSSERCGGPFVALNCGAIPETIIESELLGHEAGAFTGADRQRIGKFEFAKGGTVFLDEIESMPLALQVKLLRILQDRSVVRVGANVSIPLDVRIIAATKVDLRTAADENRFREDLYYRLNVVTVDLPPLRDREGDTELLIQHFIEAAARRHRRETPPVSTATLALLKSHNWPGNVRELKNAAERFALGMGTGLERAAGQPPMGPDSDAATLAERVDAYERQLIEAELRRNNGKVKETHEALGLPRKTFYDKMKKHGLSRGAFVAENED